jgi:hypothetical protein
MAIDRAAARQRVATITGWGAAGAVALTAAFAVGAARGGHAATRTPSQGNSDSPTVQPQPDPSPYGYGYTQPNGGSQGFSPPTTSSAPPQAMSGGS